MSGTTGSRREDEDGLGRLNIDYTEYTTEVPEGAVSPYRGSTDLGEVRAVIPGTVVEVRVSEGSRVGEGAVLLLLDAMKMHNEVCAEIDGRVEEVAVEAGDRVEKGQLLVRLH
jgi:biotin carboxyl carrier protein